MDRLVIALLITVIALAVAAASLSETYRKSSIVVLHGPWTVLNGTLRPAVNYSLVYIPVNLTVRWNTSTYLLKATVIQSGDIVFSNGLVLTECGRDCIELRDMSGQARLRLVVSEIVMTCRVEICNVPHVVVSCSSGRCAVHAVSGSGCRAYTPENATVIGLFGGKVILDLRECS